jgi:hypothetical protein
LAAIAKPTFSSLYRWYVALEKERERERERELYTYVVVD